MRGILLKLCLVFIVVDHDIFWSYYEFESTNLDSSQVTSSGGNVVNYLKGTSGDKFEFKAPRAGMYKLCFHNPYSTPRQIVSFYIHVGHIPNEHDLAKDEHLDPINVKIAELREALESHHREHKYLKARGSRHRHIDLPTWFGNVKATFLQTTPGVFYIGLPKAGPNCTLLELIGCQAFGIRLASQMWQSLRILGGVCLYDSACLIV
ncbi:hypothetical protein MKW92_014389 [Papaver armeniacum]|nr:hypothetical protein MKW92_014389 [Papaver armeniacum]